MFIKADKRKIKSSQQFLKIFDFYAFGNLNYSKNQLYHYLLYLLWLNFPVILKGILRSIM